MADPTKSRPNYIWVLAPTHQQFRAWCSDNRKSLTDPTVVAITTVENCVKRMSGFTWQDGDRAVETGSLIDLEPGLWDAWLQQLRRMGCKEI